VPVKRYRATCWWFRCLRSIRLLCMIKKGQGGEARDSKEGGLVDRQERGKRVWRALLRLGRWMDGSRDDGEGNECR
jgi:hypothetical protein